MAQRKLHIVQLLIRGMKNSEVHFLVYPQGKWTDSVGLPYLALPTKKTVTDPLAPFIQGTSIERFVDAILQEDLKLQEDDYTLEQELEPAAVEMLSPTHGELTSYTIYPVDIWVDSAQHEPLRERLRGEWLTCSQAVKHPQISPTAHAVFKLVLEREDELNKRYHQDPKEEQTPEARCRLLINVPEHPTMDALAKKWLSQNRGGVRHLSRQTLDKILDLGNRAFNLRVADPYLRYQMQGVGFTWSFFTHKDRQDTHVHGAPVVEIYGVLEGRMEIWWKPYYDRGTSAWCHRILDPGDWAEVDSLQCHIVNWLTEGKGIVFKAGPGSLIGVGRLGEKGKTPCKDCPCKKPLEVIELERLL